MGHEDMTNFGQVDVQDEKFNCDHIAYLNFPSMSDEAYQPGN